MSVNINIGVSYNGRNIRKSFADLNKLRQQAETTSQRIGIMGAQMQLAGKSMQSAGRTMTRSVSMPLALIGAGSIKLATDFETSFGKIRGLVGVAAEDIDELREAALRLGPQFGKSANEAAEALFFITSAGLRGQDAIDTLESSLKAAAAGLGDTATIADLVTSSVNAYGSATLSASAATDVLTNAVRLGKLMPEELAGAMGTVLPVASAMGVRFDEVGAAMAAMSRTGTNAATASTQLTQILSQLLSVTPESARALESVGLSGEGLRRQLKEEGLLSTLQTLVTAFDGNASATEAVFGNIRALRGVLDLMGSNVEATTQIFDDMTRSVGVTDEAYAAIADTAGQKFAVGLAELKTAGIEIGQTLLPVALDLVEVFRDLVKRFTDLSPAQQDILIKFAGLAALAGPVMLFVGNLLSGIALLTIAMGKFTIATALATGGISLLIGAGALLVWKLSSITDEEIRQRDATRDNRIEQDKLAGVYGAQAQAAAEARRERRLGADASRLEGLAAHYAGDGFDYLASTQKDSAESAEDAIDPLSELEKRLRELGDTSSGDTGPAVVKLTRGMRDLLQGLNETHVGTGDAGDAIAQFSRELLAAGSITDQTASAATRLAQVVRQDIDAALAKGNRRLEEARQKFEEYRDAISGGIRQGNTLSDAVSSQTSALEELTRAEEEYEAAVASKDVERIEETDKALKAARKGQTGFLGFLQTGVDTAEGFAAQIDSLRLAGASMDVVRQIAELGARTGGRVISELMSGGAEAIAQANRLVAAVEEASVRAGVAAADQFHSAGIRSAKQFIAAIEATIPELQVVLNSIAAMIEKALGVVVDVDISGGPKPFIAPTPTPTPTPTPKPNFAGRFDPLKFDFGAEKMAKGGIVTGPTFAMIGEAGPEAVIPLDRAGSMGGNVINVTVTSADPQAVVEALRRYTRANGPLGSVVNV